MNAFRIVKCSDPSLWYADRIGEVFVCFRMERLTGGDVLWTRGDISDYGKLLNWVWAKDAEEAN
jgi:hypothetical protein